MILYLSYRSYKSIMTEEKMKTNKVMYASIVVQNFQSLSQCAYQFEDGFDYKAFEDDFM